MFLWSPQRQRVCGQSLPHLGNSRLIGYLEAPLKPDARAKELADLSFACASGFNRRVGYFLALGELICRELPYAVVTTTPRQR